MNEIAVIGRAGRFPGARSVEEFWRNVRDGVESISRFEVDELELLDKRTIANDPNYIRARSILDNVDRFDADFFGILPKEAERIDPQHRVFLENAWEALEDAGYDPFRYDGLIAVFAGSSANTYFLRNLCANPAFIDEYTNAYQIGHYNTLLGTNHDFLATRVSYKLNLKGPSYTIQCGCSTSLVAVVQACQSLLSYQSDMAIAGGVSITFPQKRGYHYQDGGMGSSDGHCRPFDADAQGTVFGSGSAVVLLKRLEDALNDGDAIRAVIRGSAINNDGSGKVGYTAPSIDGQSQVIAMAQSFADLDPGTIGYLEAHGTATPLGDPIEFQALSRAFRARTGAKQFCALGTVKANVGHLDIASGVAGLINAIHVLEKEQIPPAIHFNSANKKIDIENSPFYVNQSLKPWPRGTTPRRAGVSSFGVGGTNAHVVIEESPVVPNSVPGIEPRLFVISAKTPTALAQTTANLADRLEAEPAIDLDAVSYTLQMGRRPFDHRRFLVCESAADAVAALRSSDSKLMPERQAGRETPVFVFMFPGQGAQYVNMGRELYQSFVGFRDDIDHCAKLLHSHLGLDIRAAIYPEAFGKGDSNLDLRETSLAQPSIFAIEYALARLWIQLGIQPAAMIGHSVGEVASACIADVFSLESALELIAVRCRLMQDLPKGGMLSVRKGASEVRPLLGEELAIAAENSASLCVVSGPESAIERLQSELEYRGIANKRLVTSHAFHSPMMDPIICEFTKVLNNIRFNAPRIPYVSCVTGTWIKSEEATHPAYWAKHFRETVRFADAMRSLESIGMASYLEVGPGRALATLFRQNRPTERDTVVASSLGSAEESASCLATFLDAVGRQWFQGASPNWPVLHSQNPKRCHLPTYPFERKRFWIEPVRPEPIGILKSQTASTNENPSVPLEVTMPANPTIEAPSTSRVSHLQQTLASMFEELSGVSMNSADYSANFLEMGFDSLFLTQVSQALQAKFKIKITFRQLLDREPSIDSLATFLDNQLPPDTGPQPHALKSTAEMTLSEEPPQIQAINSLPANSLPIASGSSIESIVREQLQVMSTLMSKQLDAIRGMGAAIPVVNSDPSAPKTIEKLREVGSQGAGTKDFKAHGPYKPVQKGVVGQLSASQTQYLDALIRRYVEKTKASKQYTQAHRKVLADPRVAAGFRSQWKEMVYPIVTQRSKGAYLWDIDGNRYIDILNGFGPIMFGHAPDFINDSVREQLDKGYEIGPQAPLAGEVAQLVCELTGMERATFCNTGSEAVMAALRVARTVTSRKKVVLFAGAYHGMFDEVLVKSVKKGDGLSTLPIAPGIPSESVANVTVLSYGTSESLEYIRAHAQELAAVLVEPVQSRHPALRPIEFLKEIRKITRQSGTALILDEVVTGFRVHPGGAQAVLGVEADLATYGKVAGGGLPIGILAGSHVYMDALDGGYWQYGDDSYPEVGVTFFAGTFVRHPLSLAATLAVFRRLKSEGPSLQAVLNEKTDRFVQTINKEFERRNVPTRIENFGSVFYFSFPSEQRFGSLIYYHLREKGVHIQEGFPCYLTTSHTDDDIQTIIQAFVESVDEMQRAGVLSGTPVSQTHSIPIEPPVATELSIPITEAQHEIWVSARLSEEASCAYNEAFTIRFQGKLDEKALQKSLQTLIERHDGLRLTFDPIRNVAIVRCSFEVKLPLIDLGSKSQTEARAIFDEHLAEDASTPFDLINGPLVRTTLVQFGTEDHALIFTSHHIVCDGWSTNVLIQELELLYNAAVKDSVVELPKISTFETYAVNEKSWIGTPEYEAVERWWVDQFREPVALLELPVNRPRGALKSFRGNTARRLADAETAKSLRRFGATQGCTLFATLLAGFKLLLSRFTGQDDIVVGVPAAGQALLQGETLVGHCVNFLPIRSKVELGDSVGAFMKSVKGRLLNATDHQKYTYGSLVRILAQPRDPSRLPLVEVQFNLERLSTSLNFSGLKTYVDPAPKRFVNFDLFLNIVESDQGLVIDCDYNRDLFDLATIDRWLGHYVTLLKGMAADPKGSIAAIPLLTAAERRDIMGSWNKTKTEYPDKECLHQKIETQAEKTPDAVAVIFEGKTLTYGNLNGQANALAIRLRSLGVRPGERVAVCLDRSLEMLVSILAVLKAGGAYVPLDPSYPADRIETVLNDSEPILILTQPEIAARLRPIRTDVLSIREIQETITKPSADGPDNLAVSSDLAYLIFTSGSTGRPKGVEITHRSVMNFLGSMAKSPGMTANDRILALTTLSFDIAVLELWLPLTLGASVEIVSRDVALDGRELLKRIETSNISMVQATPAAWRLLLEAGWSGTPGLKALCGGEALCRELADQILPKAGSLWNMYGPTETTVWSSVLRVEAGGGPVRIGKPIANTQFHILDRSLELTPIGIPGELYIGGDGLARGYWRQPELTSEKFIAHPWYVDKSKRLYATGDLVKSLPDGTLEFLGRLDSQVKVRGFRIETSEVEGVLSRYPGVKECAAVALSDPTGEKRLVAFLAIGRSNSSRPPSALELREFVSRSLPGYMVPSVFQVLDVLPKTPNGKLDRRKLPTLIVRKELKNDYAARTLKPREKRLLEICSAVLNVENMDVTDNLFDLGADSIQVFQIVARAQDAGIPLSPNQILLHRTISAIEESIGEDSNVERRSDAPSLVALAREPYRSAIRL